MMLFFLISVFVASVISEPNLLRHYRRGNLNLWQPRYPSKSSNENQNCVCFNKDENRDTELFGQSSQKLKRLVVYFYEDSKSNTVQLYAPNKENQMKFPDLASKDLIDLSKVEVDNVGQLFEAYHAAAKVNKTQKYTDSNIINLVIDNSAISYKHNNTPEPQMGVDSNTNKNYVSYIETDPSNSQNETESSNILHEFVSSEVNGNTKEDYGKHIASQSSDESFIANLASEGQNNSEKKMPSVYIQPSSHAGNSGTLDESLNFSSEVSHDVKPTLVDAESSKSLESVFSGLDLPYELHNKPITYQRSKNYLKHLSDLEPKRQTASGSKSELHTIDIDDYIVANNKDINPSETTHKHRAPTQSDDTGKDYVTFDKWFGQQMQTIKKTGKSPNKNINLLSLKHLIEKTLYDNGFFVTKDGVLTDSKANALDVANLKLRPILIGDSVAYNNVFPVEGDNYQLPSNLPYLQSVLVTLVDPPKILGVIPLGKTYVPRVSYRGGLNYLAWKARSMETCESLQCKLERIKIYNLYKKQSMTNQRSNNYEAYSNKKVQGSNEKQINNAKQWEKYLAQFYGRMGNAQPQHLQDGNSKNKKSFGLNLKKILETLKSNLLYPFNTPNQLTGLNRKAYSPSFVKKVSDQLNGEYEDDTEDSKEVEEEIPGFRIIGGFPATSSGTPVSSKGRIGQIFA